MDSGGSILWSLRREDYNICCLQLIHFIYLHTRRRLFTHISLILNSTAIIPTLFIFSFVSLSFHLISLFSLSFFLISFFSLYYFFFFLSSLLFFLISPYHYFFFLFPNFSFFFLFCPSNSHWTGSNSAGPDPESVPSGEGTAGGGCWLYQVRQVSL